MNPTTNIIIVIKPGQAIQCFLFCGLTIALFLLSTSTNLLQQPEQPNAASVEMVDGAETHPGAGKQDVLTQPRSSLEPNLVIIKHEMVSLRKLASSLSPDSYHKLNLPHKADVIRGVDAPLTISSDKAYEVIKSLTARMQKKSKSEIRRQTRSVLQSDHQAAASTTHELTASTAGKDPHVDDSAAFHVDYSGPKTHPPKNNWVIKGFIVDNDQAQHHIMGLIVDNGQAQYLVLWAKMETSSIIIIINVIL